MGNLEVPLLVEIFGDFAFSFFFLCIFHRKYNVEKAHIEDARVEF
jgi:hypothetical protein